MKTAFAFGARAAAGFGASGACTTATCTTIAMIRTCRIAETAIPPGRARGVATGPLIGPGPVSVSSRADGGGGSSRSSMTSPRPMAIQMMHPFRSGCALNARKETSLYIPHEDFSRP